MAGLAGRGCRNVRLSILPFIPLLPLRQQIGRPERDAIVEMLDPPDGRAEGADHPDHLVALVEQQLGEAKTRPAW
jgi:hypothetical protein